MTAALSDNYYSTFKIDGWGFPAGLPNLQASIEIIENSSFAVPCVALTLVDPKNLLEKELNLSDDNLIEVAMARDSKDNPKPEFFRFFSKRSGVAAEGYSHTIYGIYDAVPFTKGIEIKSWKDTSSNVLRSLLGSIGFRIGSQWDDTSDSQVWINPGINRSAFAQSLVRHSFKDENGLMRLAITSEGEARFIDVLAALTKKEKYTIVYGDSKALKGDYSTMQLKFGTSGGILGSWTGYGYDLFESRLDGKVMKSDGVALQLDGPFTPFNSDTYDSIKAVRKDYAPHDCGNVHDAYWQAFHANTRKSAMFTQTVRLIIDQTTEMNVLDVVNLRLAQMDMNIDGRRDPIDESRGGKYIITAKKKLIRGTKYSEAFLLHRLAVNLPGKATLLATDGNRGSPSPTPQPQDKAGKSEWTYEKEKRYADKKDGCRDIVDEECMPTGTDSTDWDTPQDWTDAGGKRAGGAYELALTGKVGEVKKRKRDTDPPKQ